MTALADKVALATGAGGTMGRAVVEALVTQGWRVAMVDLRVDALSAVAARRGDRVTAIGSDNTARKHR
jgi:3-oxoacyl-[acyl-carrier protein] reductase